MSVRVALALLCGAAPVREARADEPAAEAPGGFARSGVMIAAIPALSVDVGDPDLAGRYGLYVGGLLRPRPDASLAMAVGGQLEHELELWPSPLFRHRVRLSGSLRAGHGTRRVFAYGLVELGLIVAFSKIMGPADRYLGTRTTPGFGLHGGGGVLGSIVGAFFLGGELTGGADLMVPGSVSATPLLQLRLLVGVRF